jgi:hypothetical protein
MSFESVFSEPVMWDAEVFVSATGRTKEQAKSLFEKFYPNYSFGEVQAFFVRWGFVAPFEFSDPPHLGWGESSERTVGSKMLWHSVAERKVVPYSSEYTTGGYKL